jgi:hypothetical protein
MLPGGRRCRMDSSWQQTKLRLDSIRHEYRVICQELKRTQPVTQASTDETGFKPTGPDSILSA